MRHTTPWFRFVATTASGAMLLSPTLAAAQTQFNAPQYQTQAPAAQPSPAQPNPQQVEDPPALVGRVANIAGTVSFHTDDQTEWVPATLNYPVTSGGTFWTEPGAHAELEVGVSRLVLDQSTELGIDTLTEQSTVLTLDQGGVFLWVRDMAPGDTTVVRTPRGQLTIAQPGHYVVLAGDTDHPTQITVLDGAGQLDGAGATTQLQAGQTVSITGADPYQIAVGPQQVPQFAAAEMAREHPPALAAAAAPPPVVLQMTGGDALVGVGEWQASPDYGRVWYPPVQNDWVPYRDGHWAYVAPWGWTWIDNASWGFAPFHYGRWVQIGPRWGWIAEQPGVRVVQRPVYAPALVTFIGVAAGVAAGAAFAHSVGWIPLGPREIYRPPYRHSDNYLRNVNVYNVRNVTNYRVTQNNVFVNRRAATMVPRDVMLRSERVATHHQAVPQQVLAQARPIAGRPVAPTRATAGVTPTVARRLGLPQAGPGAAPNRPPAPGPAFRPNQRANVPGRPEAPRPGQPQLRPPQSGRPDAARPAPGRVEPGRVQPGVAQPARPDATRPAPGRVEPGRVQPGVAQPARPDATRPTPGRVEPGNAQPGVAQPARPDAARPAPGRVEPGNAQPGVAQPARPDAARPAPGRVEPGRVQPGVAQPARPDAARPAPGRVEPGRPQPGQPPQARPNAAAPAVNPQAARPAAPGTFRPPVPAQSPHQRPVVPERIAPARPSGSVNTPTPHAPPEARPAPQRAPQARPAPYPQVHTAPPRPAPRPEPRPQPRPQPAPQARPAPPQHHEAPRQAPQHRPEPPKRN